VRSVLRRHEDAFCAALLARLPPETIAGLDALLRPPDPDEAGGNDDEPGPAPLLLALRSGTGHASLQSVGEEAAKPALSTYQLLEHPKVVGWAEGFGAGWRCAADRA